jgi:NAD(P)-dependent dehydrogenase (short-subunit alcohol dehydrogenase family)
MLTAVIFAVLAVLLAIFFTNDADLSLILLPKPPAQGNAGKIVWIIGSSSGIGASLALDYCRDGAQVIISARRIQQLEEVASACKSNSGGSSYEPLVLPLDATNYAEHQSAFDQVIAKFGKIDILVLNAGISQRNLAMDTPFEVTEQIMKVNFFSLVHLTKIVLPFMLQRKLGKVRIFFLFF